MWRLLACMMRAQLRISMCAHVDIRFELRASVLPMDAINSLRVLVRGDCVGFDFIRGRHYRDPLFLRRDEDGNRQCKFGDQGQYHGSWHVDFGVNEVKVQL